jgi:transcriptional regulator
MHPNPIYRTEERTRILDFAAARGFGLLSINGPQAPLIAHLPFVIEGDRALFHLVRSNPVARALASGDAAGVLAVSGPDSYVSPDWYGLADQVPTWNYVAVHLTGRLRLLPETALRGQLDLLSAAFEARLAPKRPWTLDKTDPAVVGRLMRMIVPAEMVLTGVDGTWKLSQNKPVEAMRGAADGIEAAGIGQEAAALAALIRAHEAG